MSMSPKQIAELKWVARAIKDGRGTGHDINYTPWIQIRRFDLNSRGRSHVVFNPDLGRQHHVLSDLEKNVLLILIWARPRDIREQFPLQLIGCELEFCNRQPTPIGTIEAARALGYRHPQILKDYLRHLTTDFLVTLQNGRKLAVYVKYHDELENGRPKRLGELLKIAKCYWHSRGVQLVEITDHDISPEKITWFTWAFESSHSLSKPSTRNEFSKRVLQTDKGETMSQRLEWVAADMDIQRTQAVHLLKQLILLNDLVVDFKRPHDLSLAWPNLRKASISEKSRWHFNKPIPLARGTK
ncbi:TnsA endonuclease N-terminal domain-containing protein [Undibacterium terreum]|uniref:TnsA endonuclease N-terminal domain-containing protein n=1 Tax=Undibacterium terreum TaxID=1224302 RepID=UPI00166C2A86|nr:TnsA endonuclease N-terminal domain-containing protein [Undibacterium terreum]